MGLVVVGVVNFVIDPYSEWNWIEARFNRYKFWQSHQTAPFKFSELLEKKRYTVVFGTSHSSTISEELVGGPVLNLSISLYGNPIDVMEFLSHLSDRALANIDRVYYAVDYLALTDKRSEFEGLPFSTLNYFIKSLQTLDSQKLQRSFRTIYANLLNRFSSYVLPNGVFVYREEIDYDPSSAVTQAMLARPVEYTHAPRAVRALTEVAQFLKKHQIPAVYFNTAFTIDFLRRVDRESMKTHYRKVLQALPSFCSLSYAVNISDRRRLFRDPTHHKFAITRWEFERLSACPPEYEVTPQSTEKYLEWLFSNLEASRPAP